MIEITYDKGGRFMNEEDLEEAFSEWRKDIVTTEQLVYNLIG